MGEPEKDSDVEASEAEIEANVLSTPVNYLTSDVQRFYVRSWPKLYPSTYEDYPTVIAALSDYCTMNGQHRADELSEQPYANLIISFQTDFSTLAFAIARPEIVVALASTPWQTVEARRGAANLLLALAEAGLLTENRAFFDVVNPQGPVEYPSHGLFVPVGAAHAMLVDKARKDDDYTFLSPTGQIPGTVLGVSTTPRDIVSAVTAKDIVNAAQKLRDLPVPELDTSAAQKLAEGTGWSYATAVLFLTGCRETNHDWGYRLKAEPLEIVGVSAAGAFAGEEFINALEPALLQKLYAAGAVDLDSVVDNGLDISQVISVWKANDTGQNLIRGELIADLEKIFDHDYELREFEVIRLLRRPAETWNLDVITACIRLAWLIDGADPLNQFLADKLRELKKAFSTATVSLKYKNSDVLKTLGVSVESSLASGASDIHPEWSVVDEPLEFRISWDIAKTTDFARTEQIVQVLTRRKAKGNDMEKLPVLWSLVSGGLDPLIAELDNPTKGQKQDPLNPAPEIVAEISEKLGLPTDSARYWLQLLVLYNPTDANVKTWNNWTRKQLNEPAQPLIDAHLVVQAKRTRAGRQVFLPGGWMPASAPQLPMESWKAAFYAFEQTPKVKLATPVGFELLPAVELFHRGWQRYQSGDVPGFDELKS